MQSGVIRVVVVWICVTGIVRGVFTDIIMGQKRRDDLTLGVGMGLRILRGRHSGTHDP